MGWRSYHTKNLTEKYLFRFLSVEYLEDFLNTGSLWFSRADMFEDKMECVRIAELLKEKLAYDEIKHRQKKILVNCWHLANKESAALWDKYSHTSSKRKKIAIRFKRGQLVRIINENEIRNNRQYYLTKWIHGKVQYKNLINVTPEVLAKNSIKHPSFRKEVIFNYENEYRFVIELNQPFLQPGLAYNIGKPESLAFDILINPLLETKEYNDLKDLIEKRGFESKLKDSVSLKWFKPE